MASSCIRAFEDAALLEARVDDRVFLALNDVTVHKGVEINLIRIETFVDGHPAGSFAVAEGASVDVPFAASSNSFDSLSIIPFSPRPREYVTIQRIASDVLRSGPTSIGTW